MKNIDIYWFSGTGNSLQIALKMQIYFNNKNFKTRLLPIENNDPCLLNKNSIIGIVIPVIMQGTSPIVWEFINSMPDTDGTKVFFADTMLAYSGGILNPVKSILKKKGYKTLCAKEFLMPSNYSRKKELTVKEKEKISASINKIEAFCQSVIDEKNKWYDIPVYSLLMSSFSRSKKIFNLVKKLMFITIDENKCINCKQCIKLCPVNNISISKNTKVPSVGSDCILCQSSIAFCPENAMLLSNKSYTQYHGIELKTLLKHLK